MTHLRRLSELLVVVAVLLWLDHLAGADAPR